MQLKHRSNSNSFTASASPVVGQFVASALLFSIGCRAGDEVDGFGGYLRRLDLVVPGELQDHPT